MLGMSSLLRVHGLTKDFGDHKGVFDLDFEINPGEVVGFVGPNGSGKSTTINMLVGNTSPTKGDIQLFGHASTMQNIHDDMPRIGALLSEPTLEKSITPKQLFVESGQMLGMKTNWQDISEAVGLDVRKTIEKLSLGNKKKVGIVAALMHQPQLVIMDEPTSGLDPVVVNRFSRLLRDVAKRGGSVLLSSHDLGEIQDVCDRVLMIKDGKIIINSLIGDLLRKSNRKFTIHNPSKAFAEALHKKFGKSVTGTDSSLTLSVQDYTEVIELLNRHRHYDYFIESPSLEEMFAEYYL
jgi:ABC-2 type transport system ATP-binding protein